MAATSHIGTAGATALSRRYTALADAELLLNGPMESMDWPLPPLPAGISPALISYVASKWIDAHPIGNMILDEYKHKKKFGFDIIYKE